MYLFQDVPVCAKFFLPIWLPHVRHQWHSLKKIECNMEQPDRREIFDYLSYNSFINMIGIHYDKL